MPPQPTSSTPVQEPPAPSSQPVLTPKKQNTLRLLIGSAVVIAILMYVGIRVVTSAQISLFALFINPEMGGYILFLLPALVVGLVFILISWRWGRKIYKQEDRPVQAFFFGTALYLFLVFLALGITNVLLVGYARTVAADVSFAVGLIFSIFFLASIQILYVGLLVCMGLLIQSTRSSPQEPFIVRPPLTIQFRYAVMGVAVIFALYSFGAVALVASATHQQWLCNLVYSSRTKASCFLSTSTTALSENASAQNSGGAGTFTIVKTNYKQIKDLHDVGGKLAYAFENNDGTSGVVYDGQVVSGAYQKVGILPIAEVGGKLAYEAYKADKEIIVWDGQEFGTQYDRAFRPADVGGKLAYLAIQGGKQFVVWDGKEYGKEYGQTLDIREVGEKLAFIAGKINEGQYVLYDGKAFGPYGWVRWIHERDGHWVAQAQTGDTQMLLVDGKEHGRGYAFEGEYALVDGKVAFSVKKRS